MIKSLDEKQREHLKALTNTGFFVAKEGLAFRKFSGLCDLQEKNGVQMGDMYRNEKKCSQFVASIADVEKETAITEVKESRFLSVLSDGSTDAGITEQETVMKLSGWCLSSTIIPPRKEERSRHYQKS